MRGLLTAKRTLFDPIDQFLDCVRIHKDIFRVIVLCAVKMGKFVQYR